MSIEKIDSLQELLSYILRQSQTIVFGDLSRHLGSLFKVIQETLPQLRVVVTSPHPQRYIFPSTETIRFIDYHSISSDDSDLLILVEPNPKQDVLDKKPLRVSRFLVITSHFNFTVRQGSVFANVSYFHQWKQLGLDTRRLLKIQDGSVQSASPHSIKVDSINVKIVRGSQIVGPDEPPTFVIIHLNDTKPFNMFLSFLDSFDYMLSHIDTIQRWLICFHEKDGKRSLDQFFQHTIDRLHCIKFDAGNATNMTEILTLMPFYASGIVDEPYESQKQSFGSVEYIASDSVRDVCRAVTKHDLVHFVGPVYVIVE